MITLKSVFPNIVRLALLLLRCPGVGSAEVRVPSIIGDNMVLQRGMKVRIWGKANAGEHVTVTFEKKFVNTVADQRGHWQVWLGPLKAAGPSELTIKGSNVLTIRKRAGTMISNWRSAWGSDFSFFFVQLPNWRARQDLPGESDWAELREAQTMALREPRTGMAIAIDIGDGDDLHPRNKLDVGRRLAALALANVYGRAIIPSGPLFDRFRIDGNKVRISFKYAQGLKTSDGGRVKGFALAGADRRFVWADARIEGETVVVSSPTILKPVAVRYGWGNNPLVNLYNKADLPASPFRTDNWPGVTALRR